MTTGREKKKRQPVLSSSFFKKRMNSILGLLYLLFLGFALSRNFLEYTLFFYIIFYMLLLFFYHISYVFIFESFKVPNKYELSFKKKLFKI